MPTSSPSDHQTIINALADMDLRRQQPLADFHPAVKTLGIDARAGNASRLAHLLDLRHASSASIGLSLDHAPGAGGRCRSGLPAARRTVPTPWAAWRAAPPCASARRPSTRPWRTVPLISTLSSTIPVSARTRLEPAVQLPEDGVVVGIRPVGLVDDEENVGTVAVGADLDVAVGEEVVPQVPGELAWRSSGRRPCGRRCRPSRGSGRFRPSSSSCP